MDIIILCGGKGTRLSEETISKPKPMVEIGGMPILWHIMKTYSYYGFNRFILALGYKGEVIKKYFSKKFVDWDINSVDTGLNTMTGGRVKRLQKIIGNEIINTPAHLLNAHIINYCSRSCPILQQ